MQIRELSRPVTTKALNESLARKFGYKLNLEQFNDAQLSDVQNRLRTEVSQFELEESFDSIHKNPQYQKTRALLDIVNQAILEREESKEEECPDCGHVECTCDEHDHEEHDEKNKKKMEGVNRYLGDVVRQRAEQFSVPQKWIDSAVNRMTIGESDVSELKAELTTRYELSESAANYILAEGEQDKAEIIMATKDMVDRVTGWLEDVAAMKAEQLLELLDSIREALGNDVAEQYNQKVKPALEAVYSALENSRQGLSGGLAIVSGGEAPGTMGAEPGMEGGEMGADMGNEMPPAPGAEPGMGAEDPTAAPAGTPPAPEAGREKRESVEYSRRLGMLLNSKKK